MEKKAKSRPSNPPKQWTCVKPICPQSDTLVVDGTILVKNGSNAQEHVVNQVVPAGSVILAGSVVEKTDRQAKQTPEVFIAAGETRHFNLEDVFGGNVKLFNTPSKVTNQNGVSLPVSTGVAMADAMRSYSIYSLEQFAENTDGIVPLTDGIEGGGTRIKAQEIPFVLGCTKEQVEDWVVAAKQIIDG